MNNILFLNACIRPESRTLELAKTVLEQLEGELHEIHPENLQGLTLETLTRRTELSAAGAYDDPIFALAKNFAKADIVVVAAPYWDLLFPASVRTYFEHVTVSGVTFRYSPVGIPQSLCQAKRLIYVATAGGPILGTNLGYEYVKAVASGFFGIQDTLYIDAQGLDIWGADVQAIMSEAKKRAIAQLS